LSCNANETAPKAVVNGSVSGGHADKVVLSGTKWRRVGGPGRGQGGQLGWGPKAPFPGHRCTRTRSLAGAGSSRTCASPPPTKPKTNGLGFVL